MTPEELQLEQLQVDREKLQIERDRLVLDREAQRQRGSLRYRLLRGLAAGIALLIPVLVAAVGAFATFRAGLVEAEAV